MKYRWKQESTSISCVMPSSDCIIISAGFQFSVTPPPRKHAISEMETRQIVMLQFDFFFFPHIVTSNTSYVKAIITMFTENYNMSQLHFSQKLSGI